MPPNKEQDYILIGGLVLYIQKIILLGSTTQKRYSDERWWGGVFSFLNRKPEDLNLQP